MRHDFSHSTTRTTSWMTLATALAILPGAVQANQTYPVNREPALVGITIFNDGAVGAEDLSRKTPENGWFHLAQHLGGEWIYVAGYDYRPPEHARLEDDYTVYPVGFSWNYRFENLTPPLARDNFNIRVYLEVEPTHGIPGHPNTEQVRTYTTTTGAITSSGRLRGPLSYPLSAPNPNHQSWLIEAGVRPNWIDNKVRIKVEVWPDPSIVRAHSQGGVYTWEMPVDTFGLPNYWLRQQQELPYTALAPYLVPMAIIGQPPGDLSWSQLVQSAGTGVSLGASQRESRSRTVNGSWGLGPLQHTEPTHTTRRDSTVGTYQNVSYELAVGNRSEARFGVGRGDMLVAMKAPKYQFLSAPNDLDYELAEAGALVRFPMEALFRTGNSVVDALTTAERQALIDLNPLASNPHAQLPEPRYYEVMQFASLQGGQSNGAYTVRSVTGQHLRQLNSRGITTRRSSSFKLDMGAVVGYARKLGNVPSGLPTPTAYSRVDETDSVTLELTNEFDTDGAHGSIVDFVIADSDPYKEICTTVYWDTYFRTFAFRDCATKATMNTFRRFMDKYELFVRPMKFWVAEKSDPSKHGHLFVAGSLANEGLDIEEVTFESVSHPGLYYTAAVMEKTLNVVLPSIRPGYYETQVYSDLYGLKVSELGYADFFWVGKAEDGKGGSKGGKGGGGK